MAVDPKTGEAIPDDPDAGGWVDELIRRLASDDIVDEDGRPVPPPAGPGTGYGPRGWGVTP